LAACFLLAGSPARAVEVESGEKVYQRALLSTVWVLIPVGNGRAKTGTGSLIDLQKRLILTNYHVVGDSDDARIFFPIVQKEKGKTKVVAERDAYLKGKGIKGKVLVRESKRDLALIQLQEPVPEGAKVLPRAKEGPDPGQRLHSIGNPGASEALWVYTSGTCRQVYHKKFKTGKSENDAFEVDARIVETQSPVNSGDSGGPVLNDRGELVAVTQGHLSDASARLVSIFIDVSEVNGLLASKGLAKLPPPAKVVEKPQEVQPTSDTTGEKTEDADKAEKDAARKLKLAKSLSDDGLKDNARTRLKEIIDTYPKTKAAAEARNLLDQLSK
jgi:S1-C subfamily serine protease